LHSESAAVLASLVAAFSAMSAHSSKSAGVREPHHCACAREGCCTTVPAIAAIIKATVRDAITDNFSKGGFE
jgi:hypothetical protein